MYGDVHLLTVKVLRPSSERNHGVGVFILTDYVPRESFMKNLFTSLIGKKLCERFQRSYIIFFYFVQSRFTIESLDFQLNLYF